MQNLSPDTRNQIVDGILATRMLLSAISYYGNKSGTMAQTFPIETLETLQTIPIKADDSSLMTILYHYAISNFDIGLFTLLQTYERLGDDFDIITETALKHLAPKDYDYRDKDLVFAEWLARMDGVNAEFNKTVRKPLTHDGEEFELA